MISHKKLSVNNDIFLQYYIIIPHKICKYFPKNILTNYVFCVFKLTYVLYKKILPDASKTIMLLPNILELKIKLLLLIVKGKYFVKNI